MGDLFIEDLVLLALNAFLRDAILLVVNLRSA